MQAYIPPEADHTMTVHWNSRKGSSPEAATTSSASGQADGEAARMTMAELLWAMRKAPDVRGSYLHRGKRLLADPGYPPDEVIQIVADVLARNIDKPQAE
jgi:hypothetical protein